MLQLDARIGLLHPPVRRTRTLAGGLGENCLPPPFRRNSFELSLLGLINPEPLAQT